MKILITEPANFSENSVNLLRQHGFKVDLKDVSRNELKKIIKNYDGLFVKLKINIDRSLLSKSKLKFIATPTTGTNHIDEEYAKNKNIEIISLKGEVEFLKNITGTAELTFGLLFAVLRKICPAFDSVKNNKWVRDKFIGNELKGKTLGIVGLGRLGKMVARIGDAFQAKVVYYDPYVSDHKYANLSLTDLASTADIISIHVPLNEKTTHLINEKILNRCKSTCIIINTSRGEIIKEEALIEALIAKKIAGVGLDVLENEIEKTNIYNKIIKYAKNNNNIVITPHIGGATWEGLIQTQDFITKKIIKKFSGK